MNKKDWNRGFIDGLIYAVQQIAVYKNMTDAEFLLIGSQISEEEARKSQEESGYENEIMEEIFKSVYG